MLRRKLPSSQFLTEEGKRSSFNRRAPQRIAPVLPVLWCLQDRRAPAAWGENRWQFGLAYSAALPSGLAQWEHKELQLPASLWGGEELGHVANAPAFPGGTQRAGIYPDCLVCWQNPAHASHLRAYKNEASVLIKNASSRSNPSLRWV